MRANKVTALKAKLLVVLCLDARKPEKNGPPFQESRLSMRTALSQEKKEKMKKRDQDRKKKRGGVLLPCRRGRGETWWR